MLLVVQAIPVTRFLSPVAFKLLDSHIRLFLCIVDLFLVYFVVNILTILLAFDFRRHKNLKQKCKEVSNWMIHARGFVYGKVLKLVSSFLFILT